MSVITFPNDLAVGRMSWSQVRMDIAFNSAFGSQGVEASGPLWGVTLDAAPMYTRDAGAWQTLLMNLRGQTNQLALWNLGRPEPLGTLRGTLLLNVIANVGATSLSIIDATQAGKTLKAGDLLGIGTGATQQVVMVTADATADGGGVIAPTIEPPLRNQHTVGAAVVWDKPKALFRRKPSVAKWDYTNIITSGISLDLIEDTRA